MTPKAHVYLWLDEELLALKLWNYVPRVGEEIESGPDTERRSYVVVKVVWDDAGERDATGSQRVDIDLEAIQ